MIISFPDNWNANYKPTSNVSEVLDKNMAIFAILNQI